MAETEFKYDVFISYSRKDEDWAVNILLPALENAGLKVCIDFRDFEAGKPTILAMQDAAKESHHVVLVLTRNWLAGEWTLFESLITGTKDPAGLQKKLIPLLCEWGIQKDLNTFITMQTLADFTNKKREKKAWQILFTALGKSEYKYIDIDAREKKKYIINDQPTTNDRLDFIPYVDTLVDIIQTGETPLTIGIFGTWGSGKTSLMKMVNKKLPKSFTVVWFEAWKYDKEETLWRALLLTVLTEIKKVVNKKKVPLDALERLEMMLYREIDIEKMGGVKIDLMKMGGFFAKGTAQLGLSFIPGGAVLGKFIEETQKMGAKAITDDFTQAIQRERTKIHIEQVHFLEQFLEKFRELIKQFIAPNRIVIFVDDLDRCLPEKAIEVLEAIKLFLDANNCVFLVGLDQEVIARGIEVKYKEVNKNSIESQSHIAFEGIRYLEKIVQLPFQIPPVEKSDMGKFVQGLTQNWPDNECPRVFAEGLAENPRQIKRTVNVFFLLWKLAERRKLKEIKPVRLAKIVTIQSVYPDLYNMLKSNPECLGILEGYYLYSARKESSQAQDKTKLEPQVVQEPPTLPSDLAPLSANLVVRNVLTLHAEITNNDFNFQGLSTEELRSYFTLTRRTETEKIDRVVEQTETIDKVTERIEEKLDEALKAAQPKPISLPNWFYGHRYGNLENFTGRAAEMQMLDEWLSNDKDNLLILRALGGFGKSALTWRWFNNHVDKTKWQTAIWWSFYEKESGFESFLAETLNHLGVEVKASARSQVNDLLEAMRGTNILIVLDGFERLLRQYGRMDAAIQSDDEDAELDPSQRDCSSPLTETFLRGLSGAGLKSKVLMTTRLTPRVLESADGKLLRGCREEPLAAFSPEDAVAYFHKEGIKATRVEILALCAAYGYHPLSLSLLVGLINADHERRGDIEAVKNLEIFENVKARRHHVLERAYESLSPGHKDLLRRISCFRGSMEYDDIKNVFPSPDLDKSLLDLRQRGLLQYAGETQRFDMNPIVRNYVYDRMTDSERKDVHAQLAMHFIDAMPATNTKVKTLGDLTPVIELYHHMVGAGNSDEAIKLFRDRLTNTLYYQFGAYQLEIELLRALFLDGENKPPRLKKEDAQAFALNELASAYTLSGQPRRAVPLVEMQNSLQEKRENKGNLAKGLENVAMAQFSIGTLRVAERNLRSSIDLYCEIADEFGEASGHHELTRVLCFCGKWKDAEQEQDKALSLVKKLKVIQPESAILAYRAQRFLLISRANSKSQIENLRPALSNVEASAIESARRALELADEQAKDYPVPRDYVRAHRLLGAAYLSSALLRSAQNESNNELTLAEENLFKALNLCRQINLVEMEADILLDVARLRYAQRDFKDAQEKASEALVITERSGYVLQGADVNLFLAEFTLGEIREQRVENSMGKEQARKYAEEALRLATCDGPPYYYKVAYEEAERLLEKIQNT